MGSKIFDYLTESFLFNDALIQGNFSKITEQEILDELNSYREFCLSNICELESEVLTNQSSLQVVSGVEMPDLELLKQSALYIEQYVVNDPIIVFGYKNRKNSASEAINSYLGWNKEPVNKSELAKVVRYVKSLTPMVATDYVKLLPVNLFLEWPNPEQLPIFYSDNLFSDVLPKQILDFFRKNVIIKSVEHLPERPRLTRLNPLKPCREIQFSFKNHTGEILGYQLFEQKLEPLDREQGEFRMQMYLPDKPSNQDYFINWVNQFFYQSCKQVYEEILGINLIANRMGASYLSESPFIFDLLKQFFPLRNEIPINTANTLLNMDLPFLEQVDISTLMSIRLSSGEEFQNFRLHLDKQFKELRLVRDPEELKIKAENAMHELHDIQIQAINQKIKQTRKVGVLDAVVLTGSLWASIQTGSWSIAGLAAAIAAARGYKPFVDYSNQVRQNPAFFLWKVLKKSSK